MTERDESHPVELLIIRRRPKPSVDAGKGGVWKIAYADFMTAMMAFFLVMWLINATSESTKQGLANYFNPIMLSDAKIPKKGVQSAEKVSLPEQSESGEGSGNEKSGGEKSDASKKGEASEIKAPKEEAIFRDPYAVLAAIALEEESASEEGGPGPGGKTSGGGEVNRPGSELFRDPFDPVSRDAGEGDTDAQKSGQGDRSNEGVEASEETSAEEAEALTNAEMLARAAAENGAQEEPVEESEAQGTLSAAATGAVDLVREVMAEVAGGASDTELEEKTEELREEISEAIDQSEGQAPSVEVESVDEGILISLTDDADFGMFAIGSAEPRRETVLAMAQIAELLQDREGSIIIRGHTDARPYRDGSYDNWRLSTARAHMAHYMLANGGFDTNRVERIEGRADRDPRRPDNPLAAENRRIEILLREAGS